ncbi:DUF3102 domain-containing protein [Nostoc sp.]|uniref:DUF3102 domain-containing protein n=1 Tax=Nostoc sp. TaxID=1180 RepID=UPI002FF0CB50
MILLELAISINEKFELSKENHHAGVNTIKQALLLDKECGELLVQVKQNLPHGAFIPWIEANCKFSRFHASRLMNIAKNWQKIIQSWEEKCCTRATFSEAPILSLRTAIALAAAEPKPEAPPPEQIEKYKVALPSHPCYGETVEVKEELSKGDVMLCKTSKGEIPFLRKELVAESQPLKPVDAEIIDVEVEDISEQLKQAIAIIIEYLPEDKLKTVLAASLSIGKDHLPSDAQGMAARLIGGQEMAVLEGSSFA